MKTATVAHAKSHLSNLLATVEGGSEIVITRRGKPIARVVPETPTKTPFGWEALRAYIKEGKGKRPAHSGPSVAEMREQDIL